VASNAPLKYEQAGSSSQYAGVATEHVVHNRRLLTWAGWYPHPILSSKPASSFGEPDHSGTELHRHFDEFDDFFPYGDGG
jgi:hypothetical protein